MIGIYYLISINIATLLLYGLDKWAAKMRSRRMPERWLLMLLCLGGALGGFIGIYLFQHKTRKWQFVALSAIALIAYLILVVKLYLK
ncbi:MAG: DUF1294 domain-containing protein [Rikenellaceae bacterium]